LEFDLDEDIELEEVEDLDLQPLHKTETLEESEADTTEIASISLDTTVDSIEELTIDEPIAIDETASMSKRYWKLVILMKNHPFLLSHR
jgi:hypothetical protein